MRSQRRQLGSIAFMTILTECLDPFLVRPKTLTKIENAHAMTSISQKAKSFTTHLQEAATTEKVPPQSNHGQSRKKRLKRQMKTAPHKVTTRLNSFHDHFDRSLDPFLVRPKTLTKLKIFIHLSQPKTKSFTTHLQ